MNESRSYLSRINDTTLYCDQLEQPQQFWYPPAAASSSLCLGQQNLHIDKAGDGEDWNDPDLLNNPEKLMRLKFDEPLLQVATSPTFVEYMNFQTETIFQDEGIMQMLKDYRNRKQKTKEEPILSRIDTVIGKLEKEQEKGIAIYMECKNKPFWNPKTKTDMLSYAHKAKVVEWIEILKKFSRIFKEAMNLRFRRASMAPSVMQDPEGEELVEHFCQINEQLAKASKIFDMILK